MTLIIPLDWHALQEKWRRRWNEKKIFETEPQSAKQKYFITVAYPYPNSPQHIGHGRTYTMADVHARYKRMQGYNVLFPMAFHYSGTPILAMSKRILAKDHDLIDSFIKLYKVPEEEVESFAEPVNIARYFHSEIKQGMQEIGYAIDWRREFTTIDDTYTKFIGWQFRKLKEKGLVAQGSHPVGWCPNDGSPVSQHDTVGDVEPEFTEYTLIKFDLEGYKVLTATLRPETIFGVTNLWINPEAEYVRASVDGENWIISGMCVEKLRFLSRNVKVQSIVRGKELLGKKVIVPLVSRTVTIFPANFVEPKNGTGIVMSVPAHAPYDYQALEDLKHKKKPIEFFGIYHEELEAVAPIVIIESEGYGGVPALDVINKLKIKTQSDPKLKDATSDLYSHEFYKGRMLDNTVQYAAMNVAKARDEVKKDLLQNKLADTMLELIKIVTCRCGAECVVKLLNDQWFVNYSDPSWKTRVHESIKTMALTPNEIRSEFDYTVDWLKERACARKSGLGTILPWDKDWVIESLSDSVIYMAYYIIAKYINDNVLSNAKLNDDFFDYVLLGNGSTEDVTKSCNISLELLHRIRDDFEYFYPVDARHSGRDLVPNHLTFFIFNHTAIFPQSKWPRQIVVNGSVLMEGKKMSKSMGNIIPLRSAIREHSADAVRISMLVTAELLQDADFTFDAANGIKERLGRIYNMCTRFTKKDLGDLESEDRWLFSRLQHIIENTTTAMDKLRFREALHNIIYSMDQDIQWYLKRANAKERTDQSISGVMRHVLDARTRMLAPFAPFVSEEIWEAFGNDKSIMFSGWPKVDQRNVDYTADESELLIMNLVTDAQNIIKVTKIKPKKIIAYIAAEWKWVVYRKILTTIVEGKSKFSEIMMLLVSEPSTGKVKQSPDLVKRMIDDVLSDSLESRLRKAKLGSISEQKIIYDAKGLFAKEFVAEIAIYSEDDVKKIDPKNRAKMSRPYKPALYIE
ncbi:MAG: leucine--tRNA ligase [Nitrososphaerales archaeon]